MKLEVLVMDGHELPIRAAPAERDWMDATDQKYAYRCLPLNIANCFGWELLCYEGFIATWMGKNEKENLTVQHDSQRTIQAGTHFGSGILTFHVPCLFRTEPGYSLMAMGPINNPKDGISPLTGIIETDWSPYTFTMNWKFTRPGTIRFHKDEPFCHIFPVSCDMMESVQPEIKSLSEDPELKKEYETWTVSRGKFIKDLRIPETEARAQKWQKSYFKGQMPSGCPAHIQRHRTKIKLKDFKGNP